MPSVRARLRQALCGSGRSIAVFNRMMFDPADDFDISFQRPKSWWMPTNIWIDQQVVSFKSSGVENDPMVELVSCARNLLDGREQMSVANFWRGPEWHSLVFEPSANPKKVYVSLLMNQDCDFSDPEFEYHVTTTTENLCRKIIAAFQRLEENFGRVIYEARSGWSHRFPKTELVGLLDTAT